MPARMLTGASFAPAARLERGRAKNPIPDAFAVAATLKPVASAAMPTANGVVSATIGSCAGGA